MAAGQTDYGSLVGGQLGQAFAQGTQQATDNYNKGVDRKAAQANTYLTNFIGPNLQKLSKAEPRPPVGSPAAEFTAWAQRESARQTQMQMLLNQSGKYLKDTGSPVSQEEWAGLWYDPSTAMKPEELAAISQNAGKFDVTTNQLNTLRSELVKLDPESEIYKVKLGQYDDVLKSSGYANTFKTMTGADYVETFGVNSDAEKTARRTDRITSNDNNYLDAVSKSVKSPEGQALIQNLIQTGTPLSAINPATGRTYREQLNGLVDGEGLDNLINSGSEEGFASAIQRIDLMSDEQRKNLTPTALAFANQVAQFRKNPAELPDGSPLKSALQKFTLVDQAVTKGQNEITIQGKDIAYKDVSYKIAQQTVKINDINIATSNRENIWKYGALAQEGNQAVLASKDDFYAQLGEDMPIEEKDKIWNTAVLTPLQTFEAKQAQNFKYTETQLVGMTINNTNAIDDTIRNGRFHLTTLFTKDSNGNTVINKDSPIYATVQNVMGKPSDEQIMAWASQSAENYANLDTQTKNTLAISSSNVRSAAAQATSAEVEASYAEPFAAQRLTQGNLTNKGLQYDVNQKALEAKVAVAKQRGEMSILITQAIKTSGVGITKDPVFRASMINALGSEQAYNSLVNYASAQQTYETRSQNNQLTLQGQQITRAQNDEFDRMFSSPASIRMYASQPDKVAAVARAAGINPADANAALSQLASEGRTLTDLQVKSMRFDMYARERSLDQGDRAQNFTEVNANRNYNRGVYESDRADAWKEIEFDADQAQRRIQNGFTQSGLNLDYAKFDDMKTFRNMEFNTGVERDARDYALRLRAQNNEEINGVRQFQVMYLTPLNEKLNIVNGQLDVATKNVDSFIASSVAKNFITAKVQFRPDKNGNLQAFVNDPKAQQTFNALVADGTIGELTRLMNVQSNLTTELNSGKQLYQKIIDAGKFGLGVSDIATPDAQNKTQLSANPGKATKQNFTNYSTNASTQEGRAIAGFVQSAISGKQSAQYPNILTPGYCTTFAQALLTNVANVPGGIPTGGLDGANGFMRGMLTKGATQMSGSNPNGSLSVKDISNLPDGTLLFQKDGTRQGHVGIVLGGMVVQNSTYKDNKINGAVGTMSLEAFVKSADTYGVQIPQQWYKKSGAIGGSQNTLNNLNNQGGGNTQGTIQTSAQKAVSAKYSNPQGDFQPDTTKVSALVNSFVGAGNGGRITASPGGNNGLSYKVGNNKYIAITDANKARSAVATVATQFGTYFTGVTGSNLKAAYKANPAQVRQALTVELKNAGFTGALNQYVDAFIKSKGW